MISVQLIALLVGSLILTYFVSKEEGKEEGAENKNIYYDKYLGRDTLGRKLVKKHLYEDLSEENFGKFHDDVNNVARALQTRDFEGFKKQSKNFNRMGQSVIKPIIKLGLGSKIKLGSKKRSKRKTIKRSNRKSKKRSNRKSKKRSKRR